jgi:hypothetical protein
MKKFLQILGLVFVLFRLAKCQLSINGLNKTVASSLSLFPRQFCGPQSVSFAGGGPSPNPGFEITSQLWSSQQDSSGVPGYPGVSYSAWGESGTGYVQIQSTLSNGLLFRIGRRPFQAVPPQDWTPQVGVLPAIPSQTTTSLASFGFTAIDYYTLEVVDAPMSQTG